MSIRIALLCLTLVGCSTLEPTAQVDTKCNTVAMYARSIETLKEAGISKAEIDQFTSRPAVVTFPIHRIKDEVYSSTFADPADAYTSTYHLCTSTGYGNLNSYFAAKETASVGRISKPKKVKKSKTKKKR